MEGPVVLSHVQAKAIIEAHNLGKPSVAVSTDLGLSESTVELLDDRARFPSGETLGWDGFERIAGSERKCFELRCPRPSVGGGLTPCAAIEIQAFSETTGLLRSLAPTSGAPTMLVSGIPMHRMKDVDPMEDTRRKIAAVSPTHGRVLDTATGLGYTAIEATKTAQEVVTVEIDPTGLEIARKNPWSRGLFENPKITQIVGDVFEEIKGFETGSFSVAVHDPPTIQLAGELYSGEFYKELFRVLSRRGKLFHYIGDPDSKLGHRTTQGAMRRLQEAGFAKVTRRPEAFGLLAFKR